MPMLAMSYLATNNWPRLLLNASNQKEAGRRLVMRASSFTSATREDSCLFYRPESAEAIWRISTKACGKGYGSAYPKGFMAAIFGPGSIRSPETAWSIGDGKKDPKHPGMIP